MAAIQPTLFAAATVGFDGGVDLEVVELADGAWYVLVPCWLTGDLELFDELQATTGWKSVRRPMYDRVVDVPRLVASIPRDGPGHPVLADTADWLGDRFGAAFDTISLALYRDGTDSVAPHGDQIVRDLETSIMATVSLGARRRFTLSRVDGPDAVRLELGGGDLLVMGGTIQRTWRHAVPKTNQPVAPRISVMFRTPGLG